MIIKACKMVKVTVKSLIDISINFLIIGPYNYDNEAIILRKEAKMFKKCQMCGKRVFSLIGRTATCPQCGNELSYGESPKKEKTGGEVRFPQRRNQSHEDSLKRQKQETYEFGIIGSSHMIGSWSNILLKRPLDVPFYTALKNRACILIYFSAQNIPRGSIIGEVINSGRPLALQVKTFLGGSYPIARCNFIFPDNPMDRLILESPLDICEGDFQDFCNAIFADEHIDIIMTHEDLTVSNTLYSIACRAPNLSSILRRELTLAINALKPTATKADFNASVRIMESVFPSGSSGVDPAKCVELTVIGEAQHKCVEY